jgi:hypothetical protein
MDASKYDTVSAVYPSPWIKPDDLQGRAVTVTFREVGVQEFRQRDGSFKVAIVLSFEGARKRMICNKIQAHAVAALLGTERLAEWSEHVVTLAPSRAPNGRPTIAVLAQERQGEAA